MFKLIPLLSNMRQFSASSKYLASAWLKKYNINKNVWSPENVVNSPHSDIEIPNITLLDLIWESVDKWPTKTACVSSIFISCFLLQ